VTRAALTRLTLTDFRSYERAELALDAMAGKKTGKSTFVNLWSHECSDSAPR